MSFTILNIDELEFDKQNPRLPTTVSTKESEIIKYLATKTGIEDLMISIGENGFFDGEAIVATPANGKYTVLEGNRRLVALKLLQDPDLAGNRRSITRASEDAKKKPTDIPAYIVNSRDDALQYLGFRHISGVQRWDPLAKARYLKLLFNQTSSDEPEERCIEVAREIGSRRDAVRRSLDALAAYEAIEERDFFDIDDLNEGSFRFGTFYTAIANVEIASFVGVREEDGSATHPIANPKSLKEGPLEELTEWMFKKDSQGSTRLGESRNIPKLSAIIANPNALEKFRQGVSLESAFSATIDNKKEFLRRYSQRH